MTTFTTGGFVMLRYGEYDDHTVEGPFRIIKPFDGEVIRQAFLAQWKPESGGVEDPNAPESAFITWLEANAYLTRVPAEAWHIDISRDEYTIRDSSLS
jgi:hypothetical protein